MSSFPVTRLRRFRRTASLRGLVRETQLSLDQFVMPLFVAPEPLANEALPGMARFDITGLLHEAESLAASGVRALILFGVPEIKDEEATGAWEEDGIVQLALRALRPRFPELVLLTDVCLCEYTSHGHCGVVVDGEVDNDRSLELLARTAVSHVEAGADVVAPSDMMDGRVGAIRESLDDHGFETTPILAYSAKYASAFYGPFREAADSRAVVRRPARLPDGSGQRPRGSARVRDRSRRGSRRDHDQAGAAVSRRDPRGAGARSRRRSRRTTCRASTR